ncbi:MAG: ArsR family transcriptional regulator, arsenate/arsenite/antimonite-responsive transcriptional [Thermoanaerobaculia bacterium]|nr:ArsR family transcriptional regulator, arsenate/arsenite/antimonite-responsive transcriptional [Thermoanaerobaculia bacterium]
MNAHSRMYTRSPAMNDLVTLFQALGDTTRLRLLNLMSAGEVCVCFFVEILGETQPKISRHLAYLRRAGIVSARRDGKWVHYGLEMPADPARAAVLQRVLDVLGRDPRMQRDRAALEKVCCGVRLPSALQNAPKPELTRARTN